jgi:hypothetical protein
VLLVALARGNEAVLIAGAAAVMATVSLVLAWRAA